MISAARRANIHAVLALSWLALASAGCDLCSPGPAHKARDEAYQQRRRREAVDGPVQTEEQLARQAVADKYRGRIEPGVGCDTCPAFCALVDLREPDAESFRRDFRQVALDKATASDPVQRRVLIYEHNRLTCLLQLHDASMRRVLGPLLAPGEPRVVRLEAATIAANFGMPAGDPEGALMDLAKGDDDVARLARGMLRALDQLGWPEELDDQNVADEAEDEADE